MTSSFELAIDMISIRENPNFCFDKLDFLAEKKTDHLISLGTAPPTSCPLDVYDVMKCCAYIRFNFCYPGSPAWVVWPRTRGVYHEKLASGWAWHFLVTSYVPGMHVIASAQASSVFRVYLRTICCTHAVRHQKDQTKSQLVNRRSMGDAFGLPRVRVSRFLRTRRWRVYCELS